MQRPLTFVRNHRFPLVLGGGLVMFALLLAASGYPREAQLAFAAAGALALLFRSVLRVDGRRTRARVWWTLAGVPLVPIRTIPLRDVRAVKIATEARKRSTYQVGLRGERTGVVWSGNDMLRARRFAERVALGLSLPLQDGSTARFRTRDPDELEASVGERLRREGPPPALPSLPRGSRLRLEHAGAESVIVFPGQRLPLIWLVVLVFGPLFFVGVSWLGSTHRTVWLAMPVPVLIALAFARGIAAAIRPKRLTIGPTGIEVRWLGSRTRIPFDELEELVPSRDGLHLVSDEAHVLLPNEWMAGDPDERSFVAAVIERAAYHHALGAGATAVMWRAPSPAPHSRPPPAGIDDVGAEGAPARPRRRRRPPDRFPLGLGTIFLAVGLMGMAFGIHVALDVREFVSQATVTEGTVIELKRQSRMGSSDPDSYYPIVRFSLPDGRTAVTRGRAGSNPAPYDVGERVAVRYDPARPHDARVGSTRNMWALPFGACGLSSLFILMGALLLGWYREEVRAAEAPVATASASDRGPAPPARGG